MVSHIVQIKTEVRDAAAVAAACCKLGLEAPVHGTERFYAGEATGFVVRLPGWRYGVVCDLANGTIHHDNYEGRWGDQEELDRFLQRYALEKATVEARKAGHSVVEQPLDDGSIKLTIGLS